MKIKIERQGIFGDGVGYYNGKKVIVPFAVLGDELEVSIEKENSKMIKASIKNIIKPSPHRLNPVCKHFGECGGCQMQHLSQELYRDTKINHVRQSISRAGYKDFSIDFIETKLRRKARFHKSGDKLGFYKANSNEVVAIEECHVLDESIVNYVKTGNTEGLSVNNIMDEVEITKLPIEIGEYNIRYNNYFLQAAPDTNGIIADIIIPKISKQDKIVDLFGGVGAYGLLLHKYCANIDSIDIDGAAIETLKGVIDSYGIDNIRQVARNLYDNPLSASELDKYDAIIINPPRNGAEEQFKIIAESEVSNIRLLSKPIYNEEFLGEVKMSTAVYKDVHEERKQASTTKLPLEIEFRKKSIHVISCNPISLERDIKYLYNAGFKLIEVKIIDQFKWSHHVEVYAYFAL